MNAAAAVARCQRALLGEDGDGRKVHAGMFDEGVISFAHGEGMRRPHASVVAAGVRALLDTEASALDGYRFLQRLEPLEEAIAATFMADGIEASVARNVCVDSGTTRLFLAFLHAAAHRGDTFVVAPTYYYPLSSWCELAGVHLACLPTRRSSDYKLTRADLEAWYARGDQVASLRGLFLFNPTPTGAIYSRHELEAIAGFVEAHDLVALEDCIFALTEYEAPTERPHLASCPGMAERVVTISGGSKAHGLANVRVGWGCGPAAMVDAMRDYSVTTSATVPQVAQQMALAALRVPPDYHRADAAEARDRAALIIDLVAAVNRAAGSSGPGGDPVVAVEHVPRAGHSILLSFEGMRGLRCSDGTEIADSVDVTRFFLREAGVALAPGLANGFGGCQMRLCFACVGVRHTYPFSRADELRAALAEVAALSGGPALGRWSNSLPALGAVAAGFGPESGSNPGYAGGRAAIRTAFLDRIAPALGRLVARNRSQVAAGA